MRTSRIARDTARLMEALSPRRATRVTTQRQSARPTPNANDENTTGPNRDSEARDEVVQPSDINTADSDSALSSAPSDLDDDDEFTTSAIPGKRKRPTPSRPTAATSLLSPRTPKQEANNSARKKPKRQPAKRITSTNGDIKVEPPANWEAVYKLTQEMRALWQAPVDTMGCESLAEEQRSPRDRRLQTLVALMLSSQTKDTVTAVAMRNLQEGLDGGFNLEALLEVEPNRLNELIGKVGFHNNKTKYIKQTAVILRDHFDSDIPPTIEGLTSLPGVGPKMAYLCMSAAWGRDEGIGVDVHVHRITNLWGWHKTQSPEETRRELEAWLPRERWHDINHLLVGFGQTWCPPVGRKCGECRLAEERLCPSAVVRVEKTKVTKSKGVRTMGGAENDVPIKEDGDVEVKKEDNDVLVNEEGGVEIKEEFDVKIDIKPVNEEVPEVRDLVENYDIEDIGRRPRRVPNLLG